MRYLAISNRGAIDQDALRFMGFSSKRGDSRKIGFFGSGAKYAAAVLLRLDSKLTCVSDLGGGITLRIDWEKRSVLVRDCKTSEVVMKVRTRDGDGPWGRAKMIALNMTVDVGPLWEPWMAIREILSNSLDEGDSMDSVVDILPDYLGCQDGGTTFYIEMTPEVFQVRQKWSHYFRTGKDDEIEVVPGVGRLLRRPGSGTRFYRRGILVNEITQDSLYDMDFETVEINEQRQADRFYCEWKAVDLLNRASRRIKREVLEGAKEFETKLADNYNDLSESWADALEPHEVVGTPNQFKFMEGRLLGSSLAPMPSQSWIDKLSKYDQVMTIIKKCTGSEQLSIPVGTLTPREEAQLELAIQVSVATGFDIQMSDIEVVDFEDGNILGKATKDKILIARRTLSMGMRELLSTLFEEWAHRKSTSCDCTRRFQNFLIDRLIELVAKAEGQSW